MIILASESPRRKAMLSESDTQEDRMMGGKKARHMFVHDVSGPSTVPRFSAAVKAKARDIQQVFRQGVCWNYVDKGRLCPEGCKHAPCCLKAAEDKQRFEEAKRQAEQAARSG